MKLRSNQSGFSIVEIVIAVVVIGIIGLLGYVFYNNQMNKTANPKTQESSQSTTANNVKSAPEINSVADLNTAEATLEQTDPSGSNSADTSQLDAALTNF